MNQISTPKIQRVPALLRQNERFMKYCLPKMISFGPIHHGSEILKQGEHYKLLWTSKFVAKYGENQDSDEAAQVLLKRIKDNMKELKEEFADDVILAWNEDYLAWMLFVDGCSLLHFMENIDDYCPQALNLKLDQLMLIRMDTRLLENQLPRRLLEILRKKEGYNLEFLFSNLYGVGASKRHREIVFSVQNPKSTHILDYFRSALLSPEEVMDIDTYNQNEMNTISNHQNDGDEHNNFQIVGGYRLAYKNVRDLKRAGIRVMPNISAKDPFVWNNIQFTSKWFSGAYILPANYFTDSGFSLFRNLIVYEMCPDFHCKYECCSYISFMDSLIDNAEDVKELRLSGVFENLLESDEDLANLFNELSNDLLIKQYCGNLPTDVVAFSKKYVFVKQQIQKHYQNKWKTCAQDVKELRLSDTLINMFARDEDLANLINELGDDLPTKLFDMFRTHSVTFSTKYINVRRQIEKHYINKWRRRLAQGYNTYFGSPWSIIAFFAALV
ncbi:hypothetical protein Fmac_023234 [Flemingia macrophylla]|uniref:Uncharacterized protein n=1 Tax=Flemingia macrophylla TaxID=520843 RepID=A0ABD1LKW6_9FABA